MADKRLEQILKEIAINGSRRTVIKLTAVLAFGSGRTVFLVKSTSAYRKREDGRACRDGDDCISGACSDWDEKHNCGRCIEAAPV